MTIAYITAKSHGWYFCITSIIPKESDRVQNYLCKNANDMDEVVTAFKGKCHKTTHRQQRAQTNHKDKVTFNLIKIRVLTNRYGVWFVLSKYLLSSRQMPVNQSHREVLLPGKKCLCQSSLEYGVMGKYRTKLFWKMHLKCWQNISHIVCVWWLCNYGEYIGEYILCVC